MTSLEWRLANVTGVTPYFRAFHSQTDYYGKLFTFGGGYMDPYGQEYLYNDIQALDPYTLEWTEPSIRGNIPRARWSHAGKVLFFNENSTNFPIYFFISLIFLYLINFPDLLILFSKKFFLSFLQKQKKFFLFFSYLLSFSIFN